MKPWKHIDPDTLPDAIRLHELQDPSEISLAREIVKHLMRFKPDLRLSALHHYPIDKTSGFTSRIFYHAIGMHLWHELLGSDKVDETWWKIFADVVRLRQLSIRARGVQYSPFFDLYRTVGEVDSPEKAADILRSIAPNESAVLSQT